MFYVPFQQLFLIGPVFFFYTKTLLNPSFIFRRKEILHFLPAVLYLLYSLLVFVVDKLWLKEYYFYADQQDKDLDLWYQVSGLISIQAYLLASFQLYRKYRLVIEELTSFADEIKYNWLKRFLITLLAIILLRLTFLLIFPDFGSFPQQWWYYFLFSVLTVYIGISGYSASIAYSFLLQKSMLPKASKTLENTIQPTTRPDTENQLEPSALKEWKEQIESIVEQKELFLNPRLSLNDLAEELNLSPHLISRTINQGFGLNFNDFINSFRVKKVTQFIQENKQEDLTLLGLALDAGFNSKATFNRAFKKFTGKTPMQFIEAKVDQKVS